MQFTIDQRCHKEWVIITNVTVARMDTSAVYILYILTSCLPSVIYDITVTIKILMTISRRFEFHASGIHSWTIAIFYPSHIVCLRVVLTSSIYRKLVTLNGRFMTTAKGCNTRTVLIPKIMRLNLMNDEYSR